MIITISAVLCMVSKPICVEEIVTDSSMQELTMQSCMIGEAPIVKWMSEHPVYRQGYRLDRWKCTIGNKPPPGKADRA